MKIELDADGSRTVEVSSNGQIYVGKDLEGKTVEVAWEVVGPEGEE